MFGGCSIDFYEDLLFFRNIFYIVRGKILVKMNYVGDAGTLFPHIIINKI